MLKRQQTENESIKRKKAIRTREQKDEVFSPSRETIAEIGAVELSVAWFQAAGRLWQ
jgi:hypothetical protein